MHDHRIAPLRCTSLLLLKAADRGSSHEGDQSVPKSLRPLGSQRLISPDPSAILLLERRKLFIGHRMPQVEFRLVLFMVAEIVVSADIAAVDRDKLSKGG